MFSDFERRMREAYYGAALGRGYPPHVAHDIVDSYISENGTGKPVNVFAEEAIPQMYQGQTTNLNPQQLEVLNNHSQGIAQRDDEQRVNSAQIQGAKQIAYSAHATPSARAEAVQALSHLSPAEARAARAFNDKKDAELTNRRQKQDLRAQYFDEYKRLGLKQKDAYHYADIKAGFIDGKSYEEEQQDQEFLRLAQLAQIAQNEENSSEDESPIEPSSSASVYSSSSPSLPASSSAPSLSSSASGSSYSSSSSSSSSHAPPPNSYSSLSSSSSSSHGSLPSSSPQAPALPVSHSVPPSPAPLAQQPVRSAAAPPREAPRAGPPQQNFFERFHQSPQPAIPQRAASDEEYMYGNPATRQRDDLYMYGAPGFASGGSVNAHGRFNMSPAEQAYIMQMQAQQAPIGYAAGDAQSPIQRGSMAAAHQVRSMPLSDKQRKRSLGKGLGSFLMNFSRSKQDSGLGMMAESMVPGSIAYGEGLEGYEAQNEQLMREELARAAKEKERMEEAAYRKQRLGMEMLFHKERMGHQSSALAETKRYHDLLAGKTKEKENDFPSREELEAHGFEIPKDAISLHDVKSKPLQKTYIEKAAKAIKGIEPMKENLRNLSRMDELLEDYPNLSTSFARVAVNNNKENPSYLKSILQGMANQDEVDAVNEYAKLSSDLLSNQIESFEGSKMISNMHKQILMKSMSDPGTSKEAAKLVNAKLKEKYARKLKYGQLSEDGLSKGLVFKTSALDDEPSENSLRETAMSFQEAHPELKGIPIEKIEARVKALGLAE